MAASHRAKKQVKAILVPKVANGSESHEFQQDTRLTPDGLFLAETGSNDVSALFSSAGTEYLSQPEKVKTLLGYWSDRAT